MGDIAKKNKKDLIYRYGENMNIIFNLIEKRNSSHFCTESLRKSISTEKTFVRSLLTKKEMEKFLWSASIKLSDMAKEKEVYGKTIQLKVKTDNFKTITRSLTLGSATQLASKIFPAALVLLERELSKAPFRLIGLSIENFLKNQSDYTPNELFNDPGEKLESATDIIRRKYGHKSIYRGLIHRE